MPPPPPPPTVGGPGNPTILYTTKHYSAPAVTMVFSVGYAILDRKYALRGTLLRMRGGIIGGI